MKEVAEEDGGGMGQGSQWRGEERKGKCQESGLDVTCHFSDNLNLDCGV